MRKYYILLGISIFIILAVFIFNRTKYRDSLNYGKYFSDEIDDGTDDVEEYVEDTEDELEDEDTDNEDEDTDNEDEDTDNEDEESTGEKSEDSNTVEDNDVSDVMNPPDVDIINPSAD